LSDKVLSVAVRVSFGELARSIATLAISKSIRYGTWEENARAREIRTRAFVDFHFCQIVAYVAVIVVTAIVTVGSLCIMYDGEDPSFGAASHSTTPPLRCSGHRLFVVNWLLCADGYDVLSSVLASVSLDDRYQSVRCKFRTCSARAETAAL
jgi:hypothetical protein